MSAGRLRAAALRARAVTPSQWWVRARQPPRATFTLPIAASTRPLRPVIGAHVTRVPVRFSSTDPSGEIWQLDTPTYHQLADETLEELEEFFEELGERGSCHSEYDVFLSGGVLTIKLGGGQGTYVINKQSSNKQIWLSSPFSGPKRYDLIGGCWMYVHDGVTLHHLLSLEFSDIMNTSVDLCTLPHYCVDQPE